eukprot:TRINITY_DN3338_c0_g1_i1.p1 TRINITY_DN3338_c0_g1~~TRINITY_DN3338_c0_g1_i1.p1  ORF type:complete len:556 (+),score=146.05 TRINITY_DN3338_c0_g1_i1:90-1757(+)
MGHNKNIAWGNTLGYADCTDLYFEKVRKDADGQWSYEVDGQVKPAKVVKEAIIVKGKKEPVEIDVVYTGHGPIVSGRICSYEEAMLPDYKKSFNLEESKEWELALAYCATELGECDHDSQSVFVEINFAKNFEEFRTAVLKLQAPSLNFSYADSEGNIGYVLAGRTPLRLDGEQGLLPVIGWESKNDWKGVIPPQEMPWVLNPESGFLVSANQRNIDPNYKYFLGALWRPGYRARVISKFLSDQDKKYSLDDMMDLQGDVFTLPAQILQDIIKSKNISFGQAGDEDIAVVLKAFLEWDCKATVECFGATIYASLFTSLANTLFENGIKAGLRAHSKEEDNAFIRSLVDQLYGQGYSPMRAVQALMCRTHESVFKMLEGVDPWWLEQSGGVDELMRICFRAVLRQLSEKFGSSDPQDWRWGTVHKYSSVHPFSKKLGPKPFNVGPVEVPGTDYSVNVCSFEKDTFEGGQMVTVCWRMVADMADLENSAFSQIVPGQSGQVSSEFYGNRLEDWANVRYHKMHWTREQVDSATKYKLTLRHDMEPPTPDKDGKGCIIS